MSAEIKNEMTQPEAPICAICGKPIFSNCTIDHVIPQAIYKWHEQYLSHAEFAALRKRITSPRNTVRTHRHCNERKEESIVRIAGLHVSRTKRGKLNQTYTAVEPYIEAFLKRKDELRERQQNCCYVCGKPLRDGGVLRRIDDTLDRVWENACLICHRCNCRVRSHDVKTYRLIRTGAIRPIPKKVKAVAPPVEPEKPVVAADPAPAAPKKRRRRRRHRRAKKAVVPAPQTTETT